MSNILWRPGVDLDLEETARYLYEQNPTLATRFVESVQNTLKELAARPLIGSKKTFCDPSLQEIRSWWVRGFKNHIIYYFPLPDGIEVLAILHGARNTEQILMPRA